VDSKLKGYQCGLFLAEIALIFAFSKLPHFTVTVDEL